LKIRLPGSRKGRVRKIITSGRKKVLVYDVSKRGRNAELISVQAGGFHQLVAQAGFGGKRADHEFAFRERKRKTGTRVLHKFSGS
jgi:hypothetical protein